jgi:hypothetical protein
MENEKTSKHVKKRSVTLRQVSSCDTVAFVARLLLIFVWLLPLATAVYMGLGGKKPEESPAEILFIMASLSAGFLLVILARRAQVEKLVREGISVRAAISHYSRYQFFINIGVDFIWRGELKKRMVQIPATSATGILKNREEVTLMIDPEDYRRLVFKELYTGEHGL